jgi:hypothetical protein
MGVLGGSRADDDDVFMDGGTTEGQRMMLASYRPCCDFHVL